MILKSNLDYIVRRLKLIPNSKLFGLTVVLIFYLALLAAVPVSAQTVRVGYYMFDGYQMETPEWVRSGYGYDFLQELARYGGWDYEYVGYDLGWATLQKMLDEGQIDILTSARKTPQREQQYLFSTEIGTSAGILTVKSGNTRVNMGDYNSYEGLRVGMIKDSSINENFKRFAARKGFTYTPVFYVNADEMNAALQAGDKIDAVCTTNLRRTKNEWILEQFDADYFYAMMGKNKTELQKQINEAIYQMDLYTPGWRTNLWNKYYKPDVGGKIALTSEEKAYVDTLAQEEKVLTVLVDPQNAPYSYFENGQALGIVPEVFAEVARRSGFKFKFVETQSRKEYLRLLDQNQCDVVGDAYFNYDTAEKHGYKLTIPYLTTPLCRVSRNNQSEPSRSAAVLEHGNRAFASYLQENYPALQLKNYLSLTRCIEAVKENEVDVTFVYPYAAQYYIEHNAVTALNITVLPQYQVEFALGVTLSNDVRLVRILNKAVVSVREGYVNKVIMEQMTAKSKAVSLSAFLESHPYVQMGLLILLIILAILVGSSISRQRDLLLIREKNRQLSEAMQKATEASAAKSSFLSSMSHDMRTPLNGIIGFTGFALKETDPAKKQLDLLKIKQSSELLLDLVNNTLDMSKIESGKFVLHPGPLALSELLNKVVVVIKEAAERKKQLFKTEIACGPEELFLFADRLKLQELFLNLLSNAVKYTPEGGQISMSVTLDRLKGDGNNFKLVVADNGIGISEAFLPQIFEAFTQEQDQRYSAVTGTGLGLAIVKRIVDLMNGTITVESKKGQGSTFTVLLPVKVIQPQTAEAVKVEHYDFTGKKVLLCEDNLLNTEIAKKLLEDKGLQVVCVVNGAEGVRLFAASSPGEYGAILMDIHMPVMDGMTATRKIRQLPRPEAKTVPILAMTADAYDEDAQRCLAAGMNGHIAKPIDPKRLYKIIASVLK